MTNNKNTGLTESIVRERLSKEGFNELPSQKRRSLFKIFFDVLKEPMLLLLLACGTIYMFLGERSDALMLLSFVLVVIGITFYQERKTEKALDALKSLSNPKALVIRDGVKLEIFSREIVREDLVVLQEGDRIPADSAILEETNLTIDESLLTGESVPVRKTIWNGKETIGVPGGENLPFVFSGTMVTQGRAIAVVLRTGINTEIGKIGKSLSVIQDEDTLLQKETARLVKTFALVGVVLCLLVVVLIGVIQHNWIGGLLSGLTLSMAMLPEEFGVVLLIFLTLGAWRMSKRKVLTRNKASIETLGAANVLCVDKTGTLTLNKMIFGGLMVDDSIIYTKSEGTVKLPEKYHRLLEYAILASHDDQFDPIERELFSRGKEFLGKHDHIHETWKLVKEYPLSRELMALSNVYRSRSDKSFVIASKGAPEAIIDLCHLNDKKKAEVMEKVRLMSLQGLRVLGVARSSTNKKQFPEIQHDFDFEFIGLIGFLDPVRKSVTASLKECYNAGIRVIMVTGDYPGTAQYVARQIGLENPDEFITGDDLRKMDHLTLRERIRTVNVFARVIPEQKLNIVNALKANGLIVAMTGDGVNDAPALKSAHIGIAMGEKGTDVARESADIVLLNDDFSSIVQAVKLGRRIFDNLRKSMAFIFSVHLPIAGMSLLPIIFNLPPVLLPAHIAFLELIIDPACSTVFESEKEERDVMNRPPRSLKKPLFDKETFTLSLLQGLSLLMVVLVVFVLSLNEGMTETQSRSMAFITIVSGNLMLIITNLSFTTHFVNILKNRNVALYAVLAGTIVCLGLVLFIPGLRSLFHFGSLSLLNIMLAVGMSSISIIWFEGFKALKNRRP